MKRYEAFIARWMRDKQRLAVVVACATVIGGGASIATAVWWSSEAPPTTATETPRTHSQVEVITVGSDLNSLVSTSSWPGEIISPDTVAIQPSREGTLVSWNVRIGSHVTKGQVLGQLSPPPAMPETADMLADRASMTAMARSELNAKSDYTKQRLAQLEELRTRVLKAQDDRSTLLGTQSGGSSHSIVELKRENVRSILRGSLVNTYPMISGNITLPIEWKGFALKPLVGAQNSALRTSFQTVFFAALNDLNDPTKVPEESGKAYFRAVSTLVDASIPNDTTLTSEDLAKLKSEIHADQREFIMALDALNEAQLESVDTGKETFEQLREIDNEIAMLTKDLAEARGNLASKEVAESTVRNAVLGGTTIVAPRSGTISAIMKLPGEYVGPGMPVAVVSGGKEILVRFRLPNNIQRPTPGEKVVITRTGFRNDVRTATLIGVGTALDETGSYMADAQFDDIPDWPINASVRVSRNGNGGTISVKTASLMWQSDGTPYVWGVSEAGRVHAQPLTLGRTLGEDTEVYTGLGLGDRYIGNPTNDIVEDMLIDDITVETSNDSSSKKSSMPTGHEGHNMPGMEM